MSKLISVSLFAALLLTSGCGGNTTSPATVQTFYQGQPANFDGTFEGQAQYVSSTSNTTGWLSVTVTQSSDRLNSVLVMMSVGSSVVSAYLNELLILGNALIDPRDGSVVGQIGAGGFFLERTSVGRLEFSFRDANHVTVHLVNSSHGDAVNIDGDIARR